MTSTVETLHGIRRTPAAAAAVHGELRRGAVTMLPLLTGYAPFACLVGVVIARSEAPAQAWSGTWLIFAGSAHLTAVQMVDSGSGVLSAVVSALAVNARLAVFSATLAPHWAGTRLRSRLLAAATMVDPTWMLASRRFSAGDGPAAGRRFYYGASAALWVGWAAMVTVGMAAGRVVPPRVGLQLLAPLCVLAMVAPAARSRSGAACVAGAGLVAVVGAGLPGGAAFLLAMPAGMLAATLAGRHLGREE